MPAEQHPQTLVELRACARHLVQRPLTCKEHDPEAFRLIRRHEIDLDRWFTQRLGYRLHIGADTARLYKTGALPERRPLRTRSGRPFQSLEYVLLSLVLAATAAGPAVISLRDLVEQVRSAAVEADITLDGSHTTRRALVSALQWMIALGLAREMYANVDAYAGDERADAVIEVRPDRIALLALPALAGARDADELLARGERRSATRQWMRCLLIEEPVLYRDDLEDAEWSELRRRIGEEEQILDEMFGLLVEARAEGVAAIDPSGTLADRHFPTGGTVGHAALLLIDALRGRAGLPIPWEELVQQVAALADTHSRRWSKDLVSAPERLARQVVDLLVDLRLAQGVEPGDFDAAELAQNVLLTAGAGAPPMVRLLPAAGRFMAAQPAAETGDANQADFW